MSVHKRQKQRVAHRLWEMITGMTAVQKILAGTFTAITVAASVATIYDAFWGSNGSTTTTSAHGCVIQGGTGNSCAFADEQTAKNPLKAAAVTWSGGWFEEAALADKPDDQSFFSARKPGESIPKGRLLAAGGAVFGKGILAADLTVVDDSTVHVVNVEPVFYIVEPSSNVRWVYYEHPAGGGPEFDRVFSLYLDKRMLVDEGVGGYPGTAPADGTAEQLRNAFTVSGNEPVRIKIYAGTCATSYYEWGIRVTYTVNGKKYTETIGTAARPFRSVGSVDSAIPYFVQQPGEENLTQSTTTTPVSCSDEA